MLIHMSCDLCGTEKNFGDENEADAQFCHLTLEGMIDREWIHKHVCRGCSAKIAEWYGSLAKPASVAR